MLREGAFASYVGPTTQRGSVAGDRCLVISDEATYATIRWSSGKANGAFEQIPTRYLAADARIVRSVFEDDDDEFGFEVPARRIQPVASAAVLATGGHTALYRALDIEGVFASAKSAAEAAIEAVAAALESDPAWAEVRSELADGADEFTSHVLGSVIQAAISNRRSHGQEAPPR